MARQFIRPVSQIKTIDTFDDQIAAGSGLETTSWNMEQMLGGMISQLNRFLNTSVSGNDWFAALAVPTTFESGAARGIDDLNQELHDLERKRVLVSRADLNSISVPASVKATGTLTGTVNYADGDTVTIGTTIYTMKSPFVNAAYNVNAATDLQTTLANLKAAINNEAGSGTLYGAGTAIHPTVECTASGATTLSARAKLGGTQGNLIITDSSVGDPDWGAATLTLGAGDLVVLALGEVPPSPYNIAAVGSVQTQGSVVAYVAGFGSVSLNEVLGENAINPKNLCLIEDTTTHDPILSGGNVIYALLQSESNTDGSTITGTTPNRVQLTFVRINTGGTDLELVPASDIAGKTIHYSNPVRKALEDLNEQDFLRGAIIDTPAGATVTRQAAYDNQSTTPVNVTTHSYLDLEGPGLQWQIRDDAEAILFNVTENSVAGTSTIAFGPDVDVFDNDAASNNFLQGAAFDTGGTTINVGVSAGQIDSAGALILASAAAGDLTLSASDELVFSDGYYAGSTYDTPFTLSDSSAEWSAFETAYGEVSLLNAIVQAGKSDNRRRAVATVSTVITAATLIEGAGGPGRPNISADLLDYRYVTSFDDDVEVFINGVLQFNGSSNDVYGSAVAAEQQFGCFYATYTLKASPGNPDVIQMFISGHETA